MAKIIRAEIVGTRMAEEGGGGFTYNSTSYSVLVFYDNGICDLVEGSAEQIRPFLAYMKPREEYIPPVLSPILAQFEEKLKKDLISIIRKVLAENNNPIPPGILGKRDREATEILTAAGFKVETEYTVPVNTHGTVIQCTRKDNDPRTVVLKIKYDVPNVQGLKQEAARKNLRSAGFSVATKSQICEGLEQGTVIAALPESGTMNVTLIVCDNMKLGESKFVSQMQKCTTLSDIWKLWKTTEMNSKHQSVTEMIEREKNSEEKFGKKTSTQIESIKRTIEMMLMEN